MTADPVLQQLVDSYLDLRWSFDPVDATAEGVAEHDGRLGTYGADDVRRYVAAFKSVAGALEEGALESLDDEIDRTALLDDVRVTIHSFEREQPHVRNPTFWVSHLLQGLYLLLTARDRPPRHVAGAVLQRLQAVPAFLETARETLRDCPRVFVETAIEVVQRATPLFDELASQIAPGEEPLGVACLDAATALTAFGTHLEDELLEDADAAFAIGEDAFNFRLHYQHALQSTAPELWRYGMALLEEVEAATTQVAAEIDPRRSWKSVAETLRAEHPSAAELVAAYAEQMERSRQFVEERGLASIPPGPLEVVATPSFLRPLIPFAAYHPPGAFSHDRTGWFYVTPPDPDADADAVASFLEDHCVYDMGTVSLHEGYPGHHLHYLSSHAQERVARRVLGTPLSEEGWALYCEGMMEEEGFFGTPEARLFQRIALLFRAARVVLDVGLHTRGMSFEEATDFLMSRVPVGRSHAETEVRRYCATPTYQICYAVGRRELLALRDAFRAERGSDYTLRGFHDAVLSYGRLPVSLMRWGMGMDD